MGSAAATAQHIWLDPRAESRLTLTDNALLTLKDRQQDTVLSASAGINIRAEGRKTRAAIDYSVDYLYFISDSSDDIRQQMFGTIDSEVWENHLTLGARASLQQQFLDQRGSLSNSFANRTSNRRLLQTYTGTALLKGGWRDIADWRVNYRFGLSKTPADDLTDETLTSNFSDTTSHEVNASVGSGERFNYMSWRLFANTRRVNRNLDVNNFRYDRAGGELTYKFNRFFSINGSASYSTNDFQSAELSEDGFGWEGGFRWTPGRKLDLAVRAGKEGNRSTWYASLQHFFSARLDFNGSYQDTITANTLITNDNVQNFRFNETAGLVDGSGQPVDESDPHFSYSDIDFRRRVAQGTLTWRHKRTQVFINGSYEWRTFDNGSGTAKSWGGSTGFEHNINRNTLLTGGLSYRRSRFEGSTRLDNYIQADLNWSKTISRYFKAVIGYAHSERQSNQPGADLEENTLTFYLRGTF
ncbi:MAG: TIGR03016 family PEP-CTERM system-associated outer membrane protein [Kordiimonadaceae bacterium]|nr:TIGR03016 family PEP-CTERM system-associated outer membrane protein [Kordiimonadaceae bacterium]